MFDWDGWLLKFVYFYGFLVGISNFEIDWSTRRVFTTKRSTIFAVTHNVLCVMLLFNYWQLFQKFSSFFGQANSLHKFLIILMSGLKVVFVIRWRLRRKLMRIMRRLFRLYVTSSHTKKMAGMAILIKILNVCFADCMQIAMGVSTLSHHGSAPVLGISLQYSMIFLMTVATTQYYLIMLFIRIQYATLNSELRCLIEETRTLSYRSRRKGAFMTKCCDLSDRLDDLAKRQDEIQSIVIRISKEFGVQGLLVYTGYYINSIITIYMTYSLLRNGFESQGVSLSMLIFLYIWSFFYYADALRNLFVVLGIQNEHKALIRTLEERTGFPPGLDIRLELSFENFQFQLIRNPFTMSVMNIIPIDHRFTTSMFASLFMNSICLIQYDMGNF
ncbi:putative gustatory receptor 36a [Drosophila bipectinata]|uniref:putative gustatory receptor 36a n=1 Tax=Drosophila bipectinata TaxID=42026 RepID=UPI001C88F786|nr:putative gustatory receptor 36a [Drosophila bipectinata]